MMSPYKKIIILLHFQFRALNIKPANSGRNTKQTKFQNEWKTRNFYFSPLKTFYFRIISFRYNTGITHSLKQSVASTGFGQKTNTASKVRYGAQQYYPQGSLWSPAILPPRFVMERSQPYQVKV